MCYCSFKYSKGDCDNGLHEYLFNSDFSFCFQSHNVETNGDVLRKSLLLQWDCSFYLLNFTLNSILHGSSLISDIILNACVLYVVNSDTIPLIKWQPRLNYWGSIYVLQEKISSAKDSYESSLINNFAHANNNKIYSHIRNITKSISIPSTVHFDSLAASSDKANLFNHYFHSVFTNTSNLPSINVLPDLLYTINSVEFTKMEVYDNLISFNSKQSISINDISPKILYSCAEVLFRPFHHLFTISLRYGFIHTGWKVNKIVPVFKAGNPSFVKDYCPISWTVIKYLQKIRMLSL